MLLGADLVRRELTSCTSLIWPPGPNDVRGRKNDGLVLLSPEQWISLSAAR